MSYVTHHSLGIISLSNVNAQVVNIWHKMGHASHVILTLLTVYNVMKMIVLLVQIQHF